jgi:predicted Zn-dependent peptidase
MYGTNLRTSPATQKSIPQLIEELAALRDRSIITESEFQEKKNALLEKM